MRLERFALRGFAQHQTLDIEFRQGKPNLIIGPNEAGKSNLLNALTGTLFGIEHPEPFTPWTGEPVMTGQLSFFSGDERVEIGRSFLDQRVDVVVNGEPVYSGRGLVDRNTAEDQRYRAMLHGWIGFTEHDVFRSTVFVGQDQVLDQGLGGFTAQFKRLISGTREANYETAITDLEAELDRLIKLPGKRTNRRLEDLQARLRDLQERYRAAEQVQRKVVELVAEERVVQQSVNEARQRRERYNNLVESYGLLQQTTVQENQARLAWEDLRVEIERLRRVLAQRQKHIAKRDQLSVPGDPDPDEINTLSRDIERLEPRIEYLGKALERNRELTSTREFLEGELERFRIPGKVDAAEVNEVARQLHHAEQEVTERNRLLDEAVRSTTPPPRKSDGLRHALLVVSGIILIGSVVLGIFVDPLLFAGLVIGLGVLIAGLIADRGTRSKLEQDERHLQEIQRLRQELQAVIDELKSVQAQRNRLLSASKVDTLHELFYRAREFKGTEDRLNVLPEVEDVSEEDLAEAEAELKKCELRRDALLRVSGHDDLDSLYKRAREYRETMRLLEQLEEVEPYQIEQAIDRMTAAQQESVIARHTKQRLLRRYPELDDIPPERVSEFREEAGRAERDQEDAEKRLYQIQSDRQQFGRGSEDAAELHLHVIQTQRQIEQVQLQAEAHQIAINAMKQSVQEFQEHALEPVAEQAGAHLSTITDGRYLHVTLDRDSMEPLVSRNGQDEITLAHLSRGTGDQLYLAIRAALIDALSGDRKLPMLLDDPCVNFDDERLANAADLIAELATERQILLFTKDETWTRWFEPVLRLER